MLEKSKVEERKQGKPTLESLIKEKNYQGLSEHLEEGIADYLESETYLNYLNFIAQFHKYSSKNVRLLLAQDSKASHVAGYQTWKKMDRQVRKGEKALYVYAPSIRDKVDDKGNKVVDENGEIQKDIRYFLTPVFDVKQTEGEKPIPKMVQAIEGDLEEPKQFLLMYQAITSMSEVEVKIEPVEGTANGYYDPSKKEIVVREGLGEIMTLKVLVHELVHSILHTDSTARFGDEVYRRQEFEAESVAYIVCQHLGLDTSDYSFGYLASWTDLGHDLEKLTESLETISKQARVLIERVDTTLSKAHQIELPRNKFEERVYEARIALGKEKRKPKPIVDKTGKVEGISAQESLAKRFETPPLREGS